jgi:hypothetical protein
VIYLFQNIGGDEMGKMIRVSDSVFKRLQELATPFVDKPTDVIERLLEFWEDLNFKQKEDVLAENANLSGESEVKIYTSSPLRNRRSKKEIENEIGKQSRNLLVKHLEPEWGKLNLKKSVITTEDQSRQIICAYSALAGKWFYGISKKYWDNWSDTNFLALLMRDGNSCSYVLLSPNEARELLDNCSESTKTENKNIHIRFPASGKILIQEWQDFNLEERAVTLRVP